MIYNPQKRPTPKGYTEKFAEFIRMCEDAKRKGATAVLVASPHVLGDNYEELIESLQRLADAKLLLRIAPPKQ
ncbi:MAG: hypothetical protein ACYC26_17475 [Phycisphaerales bacterium]